MRKNLPSESSVLLSKIAKGDEIAFRQLYDMYYQNLFHLAFYFLKSKELAEEAVSDIFFIIWKKRAMLLEIDDIRNYLYTAIKNQSLHYIRRSSQPECDSLALYEVELISDSNNPELSLLDQEYRELIQKAINSLPEKCREVFRLVLADKLKQREIAQLLNISIKTVESHVALAYKRIAKYVNKEYESPDKSQKLLSIFL